MKNEDLDTELGRINLPTSEHIKHQEELKIPLLNYKRSSSVGLWLLLVPGMVAATGILKHTLLTFPPFLKYVQHFFAIIDSNPVLTYLVPLIFVGLPLLAMTINLLAFCHFSRGRESKELLVTIKYRPLNIGLFLFSFGILVFFFLPDALSF